MTTETPAERTRAGGRNPALRGWSAERRLAIFAYALVLPVLALILGLVHRDGELTRAQLTKRLGVSRSTIGALVADLTRLGLVEERVPIGGDRVGRPSYVVGPHPSGPFVVAVDVDVTHVTSAAVGIGGTVIARSSVA